MLRNLFASSRWSSSSSEPDTPEKSLDGGSHLNTPSIAVTTSNSNHDVTDNEIEQDAFLEKLKNNEKGW